ncbi:MAG: DUF58 domain-containing protein [Proteobacteria bacterium]|nr:DUF58 domain-containing protein [Pseudomonadota bacterium]
MPTASAQAHVLTQKAEGLGQALPPLLVRAEKIAATVILGVHGRRVAGPGETFWQYRPYGFGDSTQRIDWHRSARSDQVFIRENEWESANTLWLWANGGARMRFRSHLAQETKRDRAQVVALALASLSARAHERVGGLGAPRGAGYGRIALLRLAEWMAAERPDGLPKATPMQRRSAAVLISDFLEPIEEIRASISAIAQAGVRGHLVQIADPAEETLPYEGRIEFLGMDNPSKYLARKTETLREDYTRAYQAQREAVRQLARGLGWSFSLHRTDATPAEILLPLHLLVSGAAERGGRA